MEDPIQPAREVRPGKFGRRGMTLAALGGAALFAAALVAGAAAASAATSPTPTPGSAQASFDPTKGGHVGPNGVTEKLLTGTTADKARAAAQAAVPGATIERVETDAEGAVYEAHMVKSDGSHVTVKMDANFKVTGIENGPDRPASGA
jgi:hypothetical protein